MNTEIFKVTVSEVLSRSIKVKANSEAQALEIAKKMYLDERIVLDYTDVKSTNYCIEK